MPPAQAVLFWRIWRRCHGLALVSRRSRAFRGFSGRLAVCHSVHARNQEKLLDMHEVAAEQQVAATKTLLVSVGYSSRPDPGGVAETIQCAKCRDVNVDGVGRVSDKQH